MGSIINTPVDLIAYYEVRNSYARQHAVRVHEEFEVFQDIISRWPELLREKPSKLTNKQVQEDQEFLFELLKAVIRAKNATEDSYKHLACSMLIDLAAASVAEKADENSSGKRIGSPGHDILIKGIGGLSELSRRRRSCYGALWLKKAEEGIRSGNLEYDVGYSPSRNRSYVFISAPGDPAKTTDTIADLSLKEMSIRGSKDCVSVAATSTRILSTHLWFYSLIKGENPRGLNVDEILDATISYIERS